MNTFKEKQIVRVINAIGMSSSLSKEEIDSLTKEYIKYEDFDTAIKDLTCYVYERYNESNNDVCNYALDMINGIYSKFTTRNELISYALRRHSIILLDGKKVKDDNMDILRDKISLFDRKLSLAVIEVSSSAASKVYLRQKELLCNNLGIDFKTYLFNDEVSTNEILSLIDTLNNDDSIDGILVQLPLPSSLDKNVILNRVDKDKDVDGLNELNQICLKNNMDALYPCTPKGIIRLLKEYNIELKDKNVCIIGKSRLVGTPLSYMFINEGASVTICDSKTEDLSTFTKQADIIVSAVGKPNLVTKDMCTPGVIVVDVGITKVGEDTFGDIDFEGVKDIASYITPVIGGVGPMTLLSLAENIIKAHELKQKRD